MSKFSLPVVGQGGDTPAEAPAATTGDQPRTRAQGGDIMSEIAHEVANNKIVLYMKGTPNMPQCGFSARASQILGSFNIPYHTVNILVDPEKRQAIKEFSKWPTIPQIYVDGEFLGGSDILMEMYQNGELKQVLDEAFAG
jgi:monothiol glutaredoxin